ncbi:hypothetical protein L0P14_24735, partial [Phocaeicola dorei]
MTSTGFKVPDFILIGKGNSVALAGSVLFDQLTKPGNAFSGSFYKWQYQIQHRIFIDAIFNQLIMA